MFPPSFSKLLLLYNFSCNLAAQKAKAHEEAEKVKADAKANLDKMLDQVEKLAD